MEEENTGLVIDSFNIENLDTLSKPLKSVFQITLNDKIIESGSLLIFNPMLYFAVTENPFKLPERKYPVNFPYPFEKNYIIKFTIPEGYSVDQMPKNEVISLPENFGKITFSSVVTGDILMVSCKFSILQSLFPFDKYSFIKQYFDILVRKHQEQVVLKKNI